MKLLFSLSRLRLNLVAWCLWFSLPLSVIGPAKVRAASPGSLDASFNVGVTSYGENIALPQADGSVILGGEFLDYHSVTRKGLARLRSDASLDLTFDAETGQTRNGSETGQTITRNGSDHNFLTILLGVGSKGCWPGVVNAAGWLPATTASLGIPPVRW